MTRFLRYGLGAREPMFSQSIRQLEQAAGLPSADIRLTSEITVGLRQKITELGLDPNDTTGPELYAALQLKLEKDEEVIRQTLGIPTDADPNIVLSRVRQFLDKHDMPKTCFALKASVVKRMLKKKPPKAAMKRLGYRSIDSMLKHESPAFLYAAALVSESASWHRSFREQYAKLSPSDFESRKIALLVPQTKRWHTLAQEYVEKSRHNILAFRELGAVVVLPMHEKVDGLAITTLLLILEEMNSLRTFSSFAKLQQVRSNFGRIMQEAAIIEPLTSATLAGQVVPWRTVQRYYAKFKDAYHPELFEPHVQPEDLAWYQGEEALGRLEPSLHFWENTAVLALLHEEEPVSLNVLDVALGFSNHLAFGERIVHFFRDTLWHELMVRYLHQEKLEAAVHQQLSKELADESPAEKIAA